MSKPQLCEDIMEIKNIFPLLHYCLYTLPIYNSYEDSIYIVKKFFEANNEYFDIQYFGEKQIDQFYCEKNKILTETVMTIKCKPIIIEPLDGLFMLYCGNYKNNKDLEIKFNQYKENYYSAIEKDNLNRNALELDLYIREFKFIDNSGEYITKLTIELNYKTKIRTKLFNIMYRKLKDLFDNAKIAEKFDINIPEHLSDIKQYKIDYKGEVFEELRIECLIPFMR